MVGRYLVEVESKKLHYRLWVERNITILKGNSGTGKTDLIRMILLSKRKDSPYTVRCEKECIAITDDNLERLDNLESYKDSIVFIDEEAEFVRTHEFARIVSKSTCYFVIATRESLPSLPYSCKAMYSVVHLGLDPYVGVMENSARILYDFTNKPKLGLRGRLSCVIAEDSNSGYEFFKSICDRHNITYISASGNSKLAECLHDRAMLGIDTGILGIADGAAIAPYFDKLYASLRLTVPVVLFLPESFEYLVLRSGLVCDNSDERLTKTYMYAQSECYMSWEQYYTTLLQSLMDYSKRTLNSALLESSNRKAILNTIPEETGLYG